MKNKKILLIVLALALLVVGVGATLAYFTDTKTVTNTFTVGSVKITLDEPNWDPEEEHEFLPGMEYAKDPTVTNTGDIEAYVRVNVTVSDYAALASEIPVGYDLTKIFKGYVASKWTLAGTPVVSGDTVTYSYYYNEKLPKSADTGALFTSVQIPDFLSSAVVAQMGGEFTITVTADAIQTEGFTSPAAAFAAFDAQMNPSNP